ncbi:hypothetical protein [Methylobacterium currus]|uniref:hypothetical protein n=1 Tax=Methylobacterium currus TaxID=2051553 RepID=UPI00157FFA02|nr:hypothetical protein [Methylobacterium currus]
MADRPIIFSGPMVRALLAGTKTQTRRLITPGTCTVLGNRVTAKSPAWVGLKFDRAEVRTTSPTGVPRPHLAVPFVHPADEARGMAADAVYRVDPVIEAGDRLWVRETWAVGNIYDGVPPSRINPTGKPGWCGIRYAATDERLGIRDRPSIHMPRWASRLTLTVTEVRVQRLQDISDDDCFAEGLEKLDVTLGRNGEVVPLKQPMAANEWPQGRDGERGYAQDGWDMPQCVYADLWESLHGRGSWKVNPWVAAISFRVILANIDSLPEQQAGGLA